MATSKKKSRPSRRSNNSALGIPGLKLPRGVPSLIRSVSSLFKGGKRKSAGAAEAQDDDTARLSRIVWIVLIGLFIAWLIWDNRHAISDALNEPSQKSESTQNEAPESRDTDSATASETQPAPSGNGTIELEENGKDAPRQSSTKSGKQTATLPRKLKDGEWVSGSGIVVEILRDDTTPPCHQQFMVEDKDGRSLRFAHNIDDPSRRVPIKVGDEIAFRGQHVLGERDGLSCIHWTHADSSGRKAGGWIEHQGRRYR